MNMHPWPGIGADIARILVSIVATVALLYLVSGCGASMADIAKPIQHASVRYSEALTHYERACEPTPAPGLEKLCPELRVLMQSVGEATNYVIEAYSKLNAIAKELSE